jgi:hypothetical protein
MIVKKNYIALAAALTLFALARVYEPPRISAVSWSDERLAEMALERPELLPQALKRNPASPFRWCELGAALLDHGYADDARTCFERALVLGPNLVSNLSLVSRFYDRIGERAESLKCSARILHLAPSYAQGILESYTSSSYRLTDTLNYGLPPDPAVGRAYFRILLRGNEPDTIRQAWTWLSQRNIPDRELTGLYIDYLVKNQDYGLARELRLAGLGEKHGNYLSTEFVYNGGFEDEPSGSIFDWRISRAQGAEAARDSDTAHSGKYSLRIEFPGDTNIAYRHVAQDTLLGMGAYHFRAFVRTEGISTDKGIALRIYDADSPGRLNYRSEQLTGTNGWTQLSANLVVGEDTERVRIEVVRDQSGKFDNLIKGRVWLDDLTLTYAEGR